MADEKKTKKTKVPSALKRDLQNEKRKILNKGFRSRVSTAVKLFNESTKATAATSLSAIYSLMDKGVKKGIFKKNKADRMKSRITKKMAAKA